MEYYLDIRLRADPELACHQILSALFTRLHRALVKLGDGRIAISFPNHDESKPTLGDCLRLHGAASALQALADTTWLQSLRDHLAIGEMAAVPRDTRYRHVMRVQAKSSPARLRRRAMRRHGLDADAAAQRIPDSAAEHLNLPFIMLGSISTGQPSFPLYIHHGPLLFEQKTGRFNSYGLSKEATVPWF
jgi:CRISPR-associated endonuclease Csy4